MTQIVVNHNQGYVTCFLKSLCCVNPEFPLLLKKKGKNTMKIFSSKKEIIDLKPTLSAQVVKRFFKRKVSLSLFFRKGKCISGQMILNLFFSSSPATFFQSNNSPKAQTLSMI